jgi:hypothetical protein
MTLLAAGENECTQAFPPFHHVDTDFLGAFDQPEYIGFERRSHLIQVHLVVNQPIDGGTSIKGETMPIPALFTSHQLVIFEGNTRTSMWPCSSSTAFSSYSIRINRNTFTAFSTLGPSMTSI